jgi:hypothetical protein
VFIKTVSKLVIIGCFVFIYKIIKKKTELIQVGFTILLKKQDYSLISTLALPPETFTLVELVPFLVLTSTPSVPRLSYHQAFLLPLELL